MDKRLLKKPKYKIGDIIVYREAREKDESIIILHQGEIIEAYGLLESGDKDDKVSWTYHTKHTKKEDWDSLNDWDGDILYKV